MYITDSAYSRLGKWVIQFFPNFFENHPFSSAGGGGEWEVLNMDKERKIS